jgi:hypothetical protein
VIRHSAQNKACKFIFALNEKHIQPVPELPPYKKQACVLDIKWKPFALKTVVF